MMSDDDLLQNAPREKEYKRTLEELLTGILSLATFRLEELRAIQGRESSKARDQDDGNVVFIRIERHMLDAGRMRVCVMTEEGAWERDLYKAAFSLHQKLALQEKANAKRAASALERLGIR